MASEGKRADQLRIFFFPYLARGHMISMLSVAKNLAERGVETTMVTTPGNASLFSSTVDGVVRSGHSMQLLLIPFPDLGLPPGCENMFDLSSETDRNKIVVSMVNFEQPLRELLRDNRPDCLVGDINAAWSGRAALSLGIPHVEFSVFSAFSINVIRSFACALLDCSDNVKGSQGSDVLVPLVGLPHCIEVTKTEMPPFFDQPELFAYPCETRQNSLGIMFNTFHGLESGYVELTKDGGRKKVWCVGPVHLNKNSTENDQNWEGTKNWLDSRELGSVLYVSFGSQCCFEHAQLREIASGLESSLQPFIWVVRGVGGGAEEIEEWLPEGFREKVEGRGLVLTEWAPQTSILNHPAVGGSVLHCGWNSSIEVITAGLPVITWPLHSEQFINERLFVEVFRTGVRVLHGEMRINDQEKKMVLSREKVKEAVLRLFGNGEEANEMRRKAKEYGKLARSAMEEGGSSSVDMNCFIQELTELTHERRKATPPICK